MTIVVKRNFNTVCSNGIQCQLEECMTIFCVEVLTAQPVNTANYLCSSVTIGEQGCFDLIYHITAVTTNRICTVAYGDCLNILQRFSNLLLRERTNHIRRNCTCFDPLQTKLIYNIFNDL
ncbi:hypothetical protein D3C78_878330 [compost metagenome]